MKPVKLLGGMVVFACLTGTAMAADAPKSGSAKAAAAREARELEHGRYLILIGHCNNCHTAGYTAAQGNVPESEWLTGNPVGYRGPWGTTYASNLRLSVQDFSESDWVAYVRTARPQPPMPWWSLHATTESDVRAMYKYLRRLGPAGEPSRRALPPDQAPPRPYESRQLVK